MNTSEPLAGVSEPRSAILLFTDLIGSVEVQRQVGADRYAKMWSRYRELFRQGINDVKGARIVDEAGDGFFAEFPSSASAVRFALRFQARMGLELWDGAPLKCRLGIHPGDVVQLQGGKLLSDAQNIASRVMSIALGGQILMTRQPYENARQHIRENPIEIRGTPPLRWLPHGPYLMKGAEEPLEVFEVGIENFSPLQAPPDSEKGQRAHPAEASLGWRPKEQLLVPGKPKWKLIRRLGKGGFGEVWLAESVERSTDRHVFKFCFDGEQLIGLKREFTLFRLLKRELGNRSDIVTIYDDHLGSEPPFFLESEFSAGGNLLDWSEGKGGIDKLSLAQRLELIAKIADALAAAHAVGILHKDIKPSNILIDARGAPQLADFGIGALTAPGRERARDITLSGITEMMKDDGSSSGTPMYLAPENLEGKPFTTQSDIFAMGVLLYQMAIGNLRRPLAQIGWESDVQDEVLRGDIIECIHSDLSRRLSSAAELAQRLRALDQRREDRQQQKLLEAQAREAEKLRLEIESQRDARAACDFLTEDLLASVRPGMARGREITVREAVDHAAKIVGERFGGRPLVEAQIRRSLAVTYIALGQAAVALPHAERALAVQSNILGDHHPDTLASMGTYAYVIRSLGRIHEAEPLYKQVWEGRKSTLGLKHRDTLEGLNHYAYVLRALGKFDQAEPLQIQALNGRRELLGPDHEDTLESLHAYAYIFRERGEFDRAEPLYAQASEGRKKVLGEDHPATLQSISHYAVVLMELGRFAESEKLQRQILRARQRVVGRDHPQTISSLNNYAQLLERMGKVARAHKYFADCVQRAKKLLGMEHHYARKYAMIYADSLKKAGREKQSKAIRREWKLEGGRGAKS